MTWKISVLLLAALSAPVTASAQHSASEPVLDVSAMDRTIDPCADFYAYSCGGWIKKNPIPPDKTDWSVYSKLQEETRQVLREMLEAAAAPDPKRDAVKQKIGDYYAACMDEPAIDARGTRPLQK